MRTRYWGCEVSNFHKFWYEVGIFIESSTEAFDWSFKRHKLVLTSLFFESWKLSRNCVIQSLLVDDRANNTAQSIKFANFKVWVIDDRLAANMFDLMYFNFEICEYLQWIKFYFLSVTSTKLQYHDEALNQNNRVKDDLRHYSRMNNTNWWQLLTSVSFYKLWNASNALITTDHAIEQFNVCIIGHALLS